MFGSLKSGGLSVAIASALSVTLAASALAETPPQPPAGSYTVKGVGASFPAPIYNTWFSKFKQAYPSANVNLQYVATGSGSGINAIKAGTTDYGATDAYMSNADLSGVHNGLSVMHVPTVLGGVALGIHLNCTGATITLTGANVGDLYSGAITRWNSPRLRTGGRNPSLASCNTTVVPVRRSDSSGTTFIFTSYLKTQTTSYWANKSSLPTKQYGGWPVGVGAPRNSGVATKVRNTNGAIGYMELSYAYQASLKIARVQNGDHSNFVAPTAASVTQAANHGPSIPADLRIDPIIGASGSNSYPIVGYTFWLVYRDCTSSSNCSTSASKLKMMISYMYWGLTTGQNYAAGLYYAPLPPAVKAAAINQLKRIQFDGSAVWTP